MLPILIEYLVIAVVILVIGFYFVSSAFNRVLYARTDNECGDNPPRPCSQQEMEFRAQLKQSYTLEFATILTGFVGLELLVIWKGRKAKLKSQVKP